MAIWKRPPSIAEMHARNTQTVNGLLGIKILEVGEDFIRAEMAVDERHVQPFGILHGGVSVVLAETVGSLASVLCCEEGFSAVGLEINANHLLPVPKGDKVIAECRPVRIGRNVHVWNIELRRGDGKLSCVSRLTTSIIEQRGAKT
ncbi:MAG: hotdog fold thioesterase [Alphaproteobacteria bacterium]|jgi:1,4-dihydroxy-2-naphthoyl-CoA hydrolase|uniref:PaaI family thioesterase n=1 Tax=Rhodovarius sp. TaxID=2972673 RepID=UPI0034A3F99B|nr:hotdog fold thioesterase [Alphaproteobacteria bacterium]